MSLSNSGCSMSTLTHILMPEQNSPHVEDGFFKPISRIHFTCMDIADWGHKRCICTMSFDAHSLFLHAFINWYQVLGLCSHKTSSVYSSNRLQGDACTYPVCVPYWNVIYILSYLYFVFLCNPYNIATWTTCIYIYVQQCVFVFCEINDIYIICNWTLLTWIC